MKIVALYYWEERLIGMMVMYESDLIIGDYSKCNAPFLSILVPAYKENNFMFCAIDSVLKQKTNMEYELIVVVDNPVANLDDVVNKYKENPRFFLYKNRKNLGIAGNSNKCVMLARGRYVAFLHDDDYLLDNYFEVVKKCLFEVKDIKCLITGRFKEFLKVPKSELIKKYLRIIFCFPNIYRKTIQKIYVEDCLKAGDDIYFAPSCGTLFLKEAFLALGGFDESFGMSFDLQFFLEFNMIYEVYETSEICSVYRVGNNVSEQGDVKYDFFNYYRTHFIAFYKERGIELRYLEKYKKYFIYTIYKRLYDGLAEELETKGERVESVGLIEWTLYRLMTLLYYWNRNLDIQRLR